MRATCLISSPALIPRPTRSSVTAATKLGLPSMTAVAADVADDPSRHLYALAARVPMGQADRYAVLCAPTLAERVDVLTDAIETVSAMVEFQLAAEED